MKIAREAFVKQLNYERNMEKQVIIKIAEHLNQRVLDFIGQ